MLGLLGHCIRSFNRFPELLRDASMTHISNKQKLVQFALFISNICFVQTLFIFYPLKSFGKGCFFFQKQHYKNLRHIRKNILANLVIEPRKKRGRILHAVAAYPADVRFAESYDWCPNISSLTRTNQNRRTCLSHHAWQIFLSSRCLCKRS